MKPHCMGLASPGVCVPVAASAAICLSLTPQRRRIEFGVLARFKPSAAGTKAEII